MQLRHLLIVGALVFMSCNDRSKSKEKAADVPANSVSATTDTSFPMELIEFETLSQNPVFEGTGKNTWDQKIRERGYILKEGDTYHMWYTGFQPGGSPLALGYATSPDGIAWTRYADNPVFDKSWTEDMMVLKVGATYHMFAEGKDDVAHRLSSKDGIQWEDHGTLDIRTSNGTPLSDGPYGTPTVWRENNTWYLFYERNDLGIWLATSKNLDVWTNVQDDPVIAMGPETYDQYGLAVNQIVKHKGWYYAYYHGTAFADWSKWSTNIAASKDLVHWQKYAQNPIMEENRSSGILVPEGEQFRLYTMHDKVEVHMPKSTSVK
ncbi:hypothetical protein [uncultured Kriegella sp.]|uniref:hypothetical protein n=1 Tax=uncultured Kriegella sp. TaxID=1798910 RepID=UPI0030DD7076